MIESQLKRILRPIKIQVLENVPWLAVNHGFHCRFGRYPRMTPPMTFNEKIAHRKLYDRDPRMPRLADKILAKRHVTEILGPQWVIPSLWTGQKLPPRSERDWPIPFVLKANHGCGWNIFVLSLEDLDWDRIERTAEAWLRQTYGRLGGEWLYSKINPGLLVEPFIGRGGVAPPDYKFWVFGGRTEFVQVDIGRLQTHRQFFYDRNWNRQLFSYVCPYDPEGVEPPQSLEEMLRAADLLGSPFSFVRVDFYEIEGKPFFGEYTFYPNSGNIAFNPESVDAELGRLWPR